MKASNKRSCFALSVLTMALTQAVYAADTPAQLPDVTVTATSTGDTQGYVVPVVKSGTKTDTPVLETPVSVQSVSRSVMDDQSVGSVKDAVKNISGVFSGNYEWYDSFQIRGFDNGYAANFRDGLQQQATIGLETANLERIEVLKGPAAVLYGRQQGPGGIVNLVTKRPQAESKVNVEQQLGSYNYKKTTLDATGALNQEKSLMYRFVGAYKDNDTFQDFVHQNREFESFSLLWRPNAQFEANGNLEHQKETVTATGDLGIPFVGRQPVNVPINSNFGDPVQRSIPTYQDRYVVSGDWTWHFNDDWKFTQRFMQEWRNEQQNSIWYNDFTPGTGTLTRGMWLVHETRQISALDQNVIGHFEALGLKHNLLVGADYWQYHDQGETFSAYPTPFIPNINIYNPTYGLDWSGITSANYTQGGFATRTGMGYYLQDQIEIGKWRVLAAGRQDTFKEDRDWSGGKGVVDHFKDDAFSPRLAALYQFTPSMSVFGGYNKSFGSNNGYQKNGTAIPPEEGRQYEVGLKSETFDGRLLTTVTLFDLAKTNIKNPDPTNRLFSIPTGEMRNQGLELDVNGSVGDGYSFIASYALSDPRISKDTNGNEGKMMPNVPVQSANLWGKYDYGSAKNGWGAGLGSNMRGDRYADNANTLQLPGYVIFNAMVEYRFAVNSTLLKTKFNVDNLTDQRYWDHGIDWSGAFYGAPRTFKVTVSADL